MKLFLNFCLILVFVAMSHSHPYGDYEDDYEDNYRPFRQPRARHGGQYGGHYGGYPRARHGRHNNLRNYAGASATADRGGLRKPTLISRFIELFRDLAKLSD